MPQVQRHMGDGSPVNIEELIRNLTESDAATPACRTQAAEEFAAACRRVDEDPREQQRISDIADLIDAEDALYAQALAALDRGDQDAALPLLERAAEVGTGEAAWLLAGLLEERGQVADALTWYQRAADDGDSRADDKLAELYPARQAQHPAWGLARTMRLLGDLAETTSAEYDPHRVAIAWRQRLASAVDAGWATNVVRAQVPPERIWEITPAITMLNAWADLDISALQVAAYRRRYQARADLLLSCDCAGRDQLAEHNLARDLIRLWRYVTEPVGDLHPDNVILVEPLAARIIDYGAVDAGWLPRPEIPWWPAPRLQREQAARNVMIPVESAAALTPASTVWEALERILQSGTQALPVQDGSGQVGMVTLADLARRLQVAGGMRSIEWIETLIRPAIVVAMDAPVAAVRNAMVHSGTGLVVVTGPDGEVAGYVTAQALLTGEPAASAGEEPPGIQIPLLVSR